MSEDVRGSEPVMTTKDAILELRGDMKTVLGWIDQQKGADLPKSIKQLDQDVVSLKRDRDELRGAVKFLRVTALAGSALGALATILQVLGGIRIP